MKKQVLFVFLGVKAVNWPFFLASVMAWYNPPCVFQFYDDRDDLIWPNTHGM